MTDSESVRIENSHLFELEQMRSRTGTNSTVGLPDDVIISFLTPKSKLAKAIETASRYYADLKINFRDFLELDESERSEKFRQDSQISTIYRL